MNSRLEAYISTLSKEEKVRHNDLINECREREASIANYKED